MSRNKNKKTDHNTKKAAVLQTQKPKMNSMAIVTGLAVIIIAVAAAFYLTSAPDPVSKSVSVANASGSQVTYPVSMFDDGTAHHFDYKAAAGTTIRYFILKSSDGIIRAAFDACDVCWPAGKGYFQDGDDMVCRNCGRRFASVLVNEVQGGCNPAPLNRSVEGDQLILKVDDIIQGKTYFNFKGRA